MESGTARILIVEDEDAIRLTLRDYLERKNFTVYVASDGVGAIKHLLDHEVDLIVTDYRMDILGGDYWIKFLHRYCTEQKVLITSGFLRPEFTIPFEVIYKLFDYADLEQHIHKALSASENG
jgi:CheY-like chemotaxis protein